MTKKKVLKMMTAFFIVLFLIDLPEINFLLNGPEDSFLEKIMCAAEMMAFIAIALKILIAIYYNKDLQLFIVKLKAVWKVCKYLLIIYFIYLR